MLEKEIEKRVCDYAKAKGMLAYKFTSPSMRAVPDRMFIYKGHVFFIEFKRGGCQATAPQKREHSRLQAAGVSVHVVDDVIDGEGVIDLEASYAEFIEAWS